MEPSTVRVKMLIYVEKIMRRKSNNVFMMKNINQFRPSRIFMSMDKIKSSLKRCIVVKVMNKVESIFKWQIMTAEHVEE